MESQFSNQVEGAVPNGAPNVPNIEWILIQNGSASLSVLLPSTDADGSPLTGLKHCNLFYKDTPFASDATPALERAAGTPSVIVPVEPGQGAVTIEVPGMVYGKTYYFVASVDD